MGTSRAAPLTAVLAGLAALGSMGGCAVVPTFPAPMEVRFVDDEEVFAFDTDGDERADFWQYQGPDGRKHAIAYADDSGQPHDRIDLDAIDAQECPHYLIALDGVPFELVDQLYREGHFRFFHPPARVICCFPAMTDLALAELFHSDRCHAFQALCFDHQTNRLSNGNNAYLSGRNSPWVAKMDYRCSFWWDVLVYLNPQAVFGHELQGMLRTFRAVDTGSGYAYSVGSAGLGTRDGRLAILKYLRTIDRLCEQIVHERRGRVQLTLTADHGHNLVENRRISFRDVLKAGGYRQTKSLRDPQDVVVVSYGLVTYAELYTPDPAGVGQCLLQHEDVEFVCYPADGGIVVCDRDGQALIATAAAGFAYDSSRGDPLRLAPIIERLRSAGQVSPNGEIDAAALFEATIDHDYPDPLARIWAAFHGLVENPPDLIVNLRDGACHGSRFFHTMIGRMGSTHGALNRMSSTTFVLTTLGELPPAMRSREVLPALEALRTGK